MKKTEYLLKSFMSVTGVILYVLGIATLLSKGKNIFGDEDRLIIPVFMLLLLIVSATITGLLVLGKPIYLYFNNLKKEAFVLLGATLGWLVLFLVSIVAVMILK